MDTIISFLEKLVHYSAELGIVLAELAGIRPSELRAFFKARDATSPFREDQAPVTLQMMHGLVQLRSRTPPNFSRA